MRVGRKEDGENERKRRENLPTSRHRLFLEYKKNSANGFRFIQPLSWSKGFGACRRSLRFKKRRNVRMDGESGASLGVVFASCPLNLLQFKSKRRGIIHQKSTMNYKQWVLMCATESMSWLINGPVQTSRDDGANLGYTYVAPMRLTLGRTDWSRICRCRVSLAVWVKYHTREDPLPLSPLKSLHGWSMDQFTLQGMTGLIWVIPWSHQRDWPLTRPDWSRICRCGLWPKQRSMVWRCVSEVL